MATRRIKKTRGSRLASRRIRDRITRKSAKVPLKRAIPKFAIFDNGGKTADRFTIFWTTPVDGELHYFAFDENPYDPQGFGQHGSVATPRYFAPANQAGAWKHIKAVESKSKQISLENLPPKARKAAESFLIDFQKLEAKPPRRMHTERKAVYHYDDLDERAKDKVLERFAEHAYEDSDWADYILEDAKNVGFKITEFDIDRGSYVEGDFTKDAEYTAKQIVKDHGEGSDTHVLADQFLHDTAAWRETIDRGMEGFSIAGESSDEYDAASRRIEEAEEKYEEACKEFKRALEEEYLSMLRKEAEWLQSREKLEEDIRANEYEFDEEGNSI